MTDYPDPRPIAATDMLYGVPYAGAITRTHGRTTLVVECLVWRVSARSVTWDEGWRFVSTSTGAQVSWITAPELVPPVTPLAVVDPAQVGMPPVDLHDIPTAVRDLRTEAWGAWCQHVGLDILGTLTTLTPTPTSDDTEDTDRD